MVEEEVKKADFEEEAVCRVCHGEGEPNRPLFHPCRCAGSIKYLHQDCLMEWLKVSKKQSDLRCEICGEKFSFRRVYAPDAPSQLSYSEFLVGIAPKVINKLLEVVRFVVLFILCAVLLPFGTSCWLNLCIGYLTYGTWSWGPKRLDPFDSFLLWWDGVVITAVISIVTLFFMYILHPAVVEFTHLLTNRNELEDLDHQNGQVMERHENDIEDQQQNVELEVDTNININIDADFTPPPTVNEATPTDVDQNTPLLLDELNLSQLSNMTDEEINNNNNGLFSQSDVLPLENVMLVDDNSGVQEAEAVSEEGEVEGEEGEGEDEDEGENIHDNLQNIAEEIPVRIPPVVIDPDQQLYDIFFTGPIWKPICLAFGYFLAHLAFLSCFLFLPIEIGRFVLSGLMQLVLITQPASTQAPLIQHVLKFNVQNHNSYLYQILFQIFERRNFPYPANSTETFGDNYFNDDEISILGASFHDSDEFEGEKFNILRYYSKIPLTVDHMTNTFLLVLEISVGYMFLLTLTLVLFCIYIVIRQTKSRHDVPIRNNQMIPPQLQPPQQQPPQNSPYQQRLLHVYTEVTKWGKVSFFLAIDWTVVPHFIGWILDFVTLNVFSTTIQSRLRFFQLNPIISIFLHYICGFAFSIHVAITASELRKIIKYSLLNQLLPHNLFDFDENNFEFMANSSLRVLFERSLLKLCCYVPSIVLMVLIPTQFGHYLLPGLPKWKLDAGDVPYDVQLPLELLLYHFFLPYLVRKCSHSECMRAYVTGALLYSCNVVGLTSYLLEQEAIDEFLLKYFPPQPTFHDNIQINPPLPLPVPQEQVQEPVREEEQVDLPVVDVENVVVAVPEFNENNQSNEVGEVGIAQGEDNSQSTTILYSNEEVEVEEVVPPPLPILPSSTSRPQYLFFKCLWVISSFCFFTVAVFSVTFHLPLFLGRQAMNFFNLQAVNDYHAVSVGFSLILGFYFAGAHVLKEAKNQLEFMALTRFVTKWSIVGLKTVILGSIWLTILPFLTGLVFEAAIVIPLLTSYSESPSYSLVQDWAMGLLILTAGIRGLTYGLFGQELWRMRFQLILLRGFERVDFLFTWNEVTLPLLTILLDHLLIPYCVARSLGLFYLESYQQRSLIMRFSFLLYVIIKAVLQISRLISEQLKVLHNDIRDSRYLLGTELKNR